MLITRDNNTVKRAMKPTARRQPVNISIIQYSQLVTFYVSENSNLGNKPLGHNKAVDVFKPCIGKIQMKKLSRYFLVPKQNLYMDTADLKQMLTLALNTHSPGNGSGL
jgi:hypothetical protein